VTVTEISGSESFIHADVGFGSWVCLSEGVRDLSPGAKVAARVDLDRAFVFDETGRLASPPAPPQGS
jgi:glycerol transport system ATP-binding protein